MPLKLVSQTEVAVIRLLGDVDMEDVVDLRNAITSLMEEGCNQLVLDLGAVQHLNATCLGILTDLLKRLRALQGDLRLAALNPRVKNIFELTGMDRIYRIFKQRELAVDSFRELSCAAA